MTFDLQAAIDGELGPARGARARWLLACLAGADDGTVSEDALPGLLGPAYTQPERFRPALAWWGQRLGAFEALATRRGERGELEVELRDPKGRPWTFRCWIEAEPPHRIQHWNVRRPLPAGAVLRIATEADAEDLAAVERLCPIERDDGSRVTLVRGRSLFDQLRFADWGLIAILEQDGDPIACDARLRHLVRIAGREARLIYRFRTRVAPSHRRLGLNETLAALLAEEQILRGIQGDGFQVYVDPRNQVIRDWSPTPPWTARPLRALLRCSTLTGPPFGRPATPVDAPRIAALLRAAHGGEELYVPHDAAAVLDRLGRLPDRYGFAQLWIGEHAVMGVWEDREERLLQHGAGTDASVRATVLDWGCTPDEAGRAGLEGLARAWCTHLSERGITHLSMFLSPVSAAAPLLLRLAESVVAVELQCSIPEPEATAERGVYVDPALY